MLQTKLKPNQHLYKICIIGNSITGNTKLCNLLILSPLNFLLGFLIPTLELEEGHEIRMIRWFLMHSSIDLLQDLVLELFLESRHLFV